MIDNSTSTCLTYFVWKRSFIWELRIKLHSYGYVLINVTDGHRVHRSLQSVYKSGRQTFLIFIFLSLFFGDFQKSVQFATDDYWSKWYLVKKWLSATPIFLSGQTDDTFSVRRHHVTYLYIAILYSYTDEFAEMRGKTAQRIKTRKKAALLLWKPSHNMIFLKQISAVFEKFEYSRAS